MTRAAERLLEAFRMHGGVMTRAEIDREGHSNRTITLLLQSGSITRPRHGVYRIAEFVPAGESAFVEACRIAPRGVVCLTSALSQHGLVTQIPITVDLAVPAGNENASAPDLPVRYVELPPKLLLRDVARLEASVGGFYRIFTAERSVCDAFRSRRLVGEDIAYEAFGALLRQKFDRNKLLDCANVTGTEKFILPALRTLGL